MNNLSKHREREVKPGVQSPESCQGFLNACRNRDINSAKSFISTGVDKNFKDSNGLQAIHYASLSGDKEIVQWLMSIGVQINARDDNGTSPLHYACLKGHIDLVKWMLTNKVFKNNRNSDGMTPLLFAAAGGHLEIVQLLVAEKSFTFVANKDGDNALHLAYQNNRLDVAEWLLQNGMDPNTKNKDGKIPSELLSSNGSNSHPDKKGYIEFTISSSFDKNRVAAISPQTTSTQSPASNSSMASNIVEPVTPVGSEIKQTLEVTPTRSSTASNIKVIRFITAQDLDKVQSMHCTVGCSWKDIQESFSNALSIAGVNSTDILMSLVLLNENKVKISDRLTTSEGFWKSYSDSYDWKKGTIYLVHTAPVVIPQTQITTPTKPAVTPEKHSPSPSKPTVAKLPANVVSFGVNTSAENQLFFQAVCDGDISRARVFADNRKFDIHCKDDRGRQAVHFASMFGHLDMLTWLVDIGAQINARDDDSMSPLHVACEYGHLPLVRWMLNQRVFKNNRSVTGMTPLLSAAAGGHSDIVQLLIAEKALIFAANNEGNTALHFAYQSGHWPLAKWLVQIGMDEEVKNKKNQRPIDLYVPPEQQMNNIIHSQHEAQVEVEAAGIDVELPNGVSESTPNQNLNLDSGHDTEDADIRRRGGAADMNSHNNNNGINKGTNSVLYNASEDTNLSHAVQRESDSISHETLVLRENSSEGAPTSSSQATEKDVLGRSWKTAPAAANHKSSSNDREMISLYMRKGSDPRGRLYEIPVPQQCEWSEITTRICETMQFTIPIHLVMRDGDGDDLSPPLSDAKKFWKFLSKLEVANGRYFSVHKSEKTADHSHRSVTAELQPNNVKVNDTPASVSKAQDVPLPQPNKAAAQVSPAAVPSSNRRASQLFKALKIKVSPDLVKDYALLVQSNCAWVELLDKVAHAASIDVSSIQYMVRWDKNNHSHRRDPIADALNAVMDADVFWSIYNEYSSGEEVPIFVVYLNAVGQLAMRRAAHGNADRSEPPIPLPDAALTSESIADITRLREAKLGLSLQSSAIRHDQSLGRSDESNISEDGEEEIDEDENLESFFFACVNGDKVAAEKLLCDGVDILAQDLSGLQAVHFATISGNLELAKFLHQNGALLDVKDNNGMTGLLYACELGHRDLVTWYIQHDCNISNVNNKGMSPLLLAASCGHMDVVEELLKHDANIFAENNEKKNAIQLASARGHRKIAQLLTSAMRNSVSESSRKNQKLLMESQQISIATGNNKDNTSATNVSSDGMSLDLSMSSLDLRIAGVKNDLNNIASTPIGSTTSASRDKVNDLSRDVSSNDKPDAVAPTRRNRREDRMGSSKETETTPTKVIVSEDIIVENSHVTTTAKQQSPEEVIVVKKNPIVRNPVAHALCESCLNGDVDGVLSAIKQGADVNCIANADKYTPLHIACREGFLEIVRELVVHGANIRAQDALGLTPLHVSAELGQVDAVMFLLERGSSVTDVDLEGLTAMHYACLKGHIEVAEVLVEAGADADVADKALNTSLHLACMSGNLELVEWLVLDVDASWTFINIHGQDALCLAKNLGYDDIVNFLTDTAEEENERRRQEQVAHAAAKAKSEAELRESHRVDELMKAELRARAQAEAKEAYMRQQIEEAQAKAKAEADALHRATKSAELQAACVSGNYETAMMLIGSGADVNSR